MKTHAVMSVAVVKVLLALGEADTQEVMMHKDRQGGVGGRHGIPSSMSLRRQHSKLPPKEVFNNVMYIVGGWTQEDPSCPVEQFCPLENEWKNMASMINHRGNVAVCGLYGKIYTVGGSDGVTYKSNVDRYDPQTNTWSNDVAPLSSPRSGVCLVEMDGYLYALGGYDGMVCTNTVDRYNPKMNSWTKQAPMLSKRCGAAAAVMEGQLYVIGGSDEDVPMNTGFPENQIGRFLESGGKKEMWNPSSRNPGKPGFWESYRNFLTLIRTDCMVDLCLCFRGLSMSDLWTHHRKGPEFALVRSCSQKKLLVLLTV
ncbi:kelch-like protein diablo isoform X3 [Salmo trutta]|uniref:kelch-like protein diablo isoform X3 n=1 Tax=Salmo trutta TaxID=8032 RepID=UPI001131E859|nr:kelch-like protein diablo isoform X3 [Salmo trutta]